MAMFLIDMVAKELHMNPNELLEEGLGTYLEKRFSKVEAGIYPLARKHDLRDVFDLFFSIRAGFGTKRGK